ncbi:MAG: ATP-binding protein, partial [bacterium]
QLLIEDLFSNAMEDSQSAFDLVEVIDLAVAETRTDFQAKNCSLYLNVDKTIPSIAGSSEPFKRILCQLMHNAITASQPGGMVQLDVRLDMAEDQQILLVEVTDSGEGILPEDLDKVFLAPDNGEDIQVSGLGDFPADLQVTRSLVESLGGEISIESAVGEGTTFHISLPVDFAGQGFVKDADEDQG